MDQDLALMRTKVEQLTGNPSIELIPEILPKKTTTNELKCDGADCGCSLWHIVLIIILIALIPLIFTYFYIKSHQRNKL